MTDHGGKPLKQYRISFERKDGGVLCGEMWPVRESKPLTCSEEDAWLHARDLAAGHVGEFVNIYVINADDFTPVPGYRDKIILNRPPSAKPAPPAYTAETHNELSLKFIMDILGDALKRGATPQEIMVLVESCVLGAYLALVKLGGDDKVLDVMVANIRRRLAEERLTSLQTEGKA